MPKSYEAQATVVVGPGINGKVQDYNQLLSSQQLARTYAAAAMTRRMADDVIAALHLDTTPEAFLRTLSVDTGRDTPIVTIGYESADPAAAAAIANEVATRLVTKAGEIQGTDQDVVQIVRAHQRTRGQHRGDPGTDQRSSSDRQADPGRSRAARQQPGPARLLQASLASLRHRRLSAMPAPHQSSTRRRHQSSRRHPDSW
jgi:hypothetical protein